MKANFTPYTANDQECQTPSSIERIHSVSLNRQLAITRKATKHTSDKGHIGVTPFAVSIRILLVAF